MAERRPRNRSRRYKNGPVSLFVVSADFCLGWRSAMPNALRASVGGVVFASSAQRLARASVGRRALARGFQQKLARAGISFASVVAPETTGVT